MEDGICWAAQEKIGERIGIGRQAVCEHAQKLVKAGYLSIVDSEDGKTIRYKDTGKAGISGQISAYPVAQNDNPCRPKRQPLSPKTTTPVDENDTKKHDKKEFEERIKDTIIISGGSCISDPALDYPDDIQNILREFVKYWPLDFPPRPRNGKQTGDYAQWIGELRELYLATKEFGVSILEPVYQDWKRSQFTVSHPKALLKVVHAKVAVMRAQNTNSRGWQPNYEGGVYQGDHSDKEFQRWQEERAKKKASEKQE